MFTPNEDRSGRRRNSNISPRSNNPDQTDPRGATRQTPESSNGTIVSQLREINLQENENRITIPSGCLSFCQHGNCTDPNCNSYWSLPLTPQIENRRRSTEVNKENVGSDSRQKTSPFTTPGAARSEKKTTPTNTSSRDKRKSPIYENLLVYKATEANVSTSSPSGVSNQTRVPPSGHGFSESEKRDTTSHIPVGRGNKALPPSGNLNRSNENIVNTPIGNSTWNPTRILSSTPGRPTASRVSELVKTFSATPASSELDRRVTSSHNIRVRNRNYGESVLIGNTLPRRNIPDQPSVLTTATSFKAVTTPMPGERDTDNRRPPFRNNLNPTNGGSARLSYQPGTSSTDAQRTIPSQIPIRRPEHTSTDDLNESRDRILKTESTYTPRRRISPLNLLKVRKTDNKDALDAARRRIENLGSAVEEVPEENVLELIPEITSMERHLPLVSFEQLPEYSRPTVGMGVQIQEIDIGQPCLDCGKCKGYEAHTWRKNCKNCKCPRDNHAISEFAARSRIGFSSNNEAFDPRTLGYTFVPSGITKANQAAQYYTLLPSNEVPKIGSEGEVKRSKRLVKQLPKQDLALTACKFVENNQKGSYQDFVQARNEIALDIGYVKPSASSGTCEYCEKTIPSGQYSVSALKMNDAQWHPACFRCTECEDLLVDLAYCVYKDKIYCERHYAECLKPRCEGCDELIFSGEYTKAMNKDWHGQHFCCWQCDESLTGQRYVLRDDHPYCVSCYESVFANACEKCSRTIGIDSKDLSYKDKHWHEACFLCTTCGESLVDKQFGSKGERIYCGRCYDNQFASRCDGCNEIFRAGTKKMEYKTRQWHEKCFCCCVCKVPIGTQSFIPREQEIYCAKCYEEKFATRCIKCNKVITSGGVTYKNEPWHRECFTCTHCSKSLAGERFTSRDDKPYCAECFGELFAKRCFACNKPITGIGGTKFISFEDRHWHNDCFFCAMCRTSLVGRGFITDQDDIICPECAKQKLL